MAEAEMKPSLVKAPAGKLRSRVKEEDPQVLVDDRLKQVAERLEKVERALSAATAALAGIVTEPASSSPGHPQINTFWDDPFSEATATANPVMAPVVAVAAAVQTSKLLAISLVDPAQPPALHAPESEGFRYWNVANVLTRGIAFWEPLLPKNTRWTAPLPLPVVVNASPPELNAYYMRQRGLRFYGATAGGQFIHSAESPDVVLHELGHAILDAVRPQMFGTAAYELAAMHEAFGDISAVLCGLQIPELRALVLAETSGRLSYNSRLSRLAEQLAWGLRVGKPDSVMPDALRNLSVEFTYQAPESLPDWASMDRLSRAEHSLSRVFSGAMLAALDGFARIDGPATSDTVLRATQHLGQLLIDGLVNAPISNRFFSAVAAEMIQADQSRFAGRYRDALTLVFRRRGILNVNSVQAVVAQGESMMAGIAASRSAAKGAEVGAAHTLGYDDLPPPTMSPVEIGAITVLAEKTTDSSLMVKRPRGMAGGAEMAVAAATPHPAPTPDDEARSYIESLFQRGMVDTSQIRSHVGMGGLAGGGQRMTHSVVPGDGNKLIFQRMRFSCTCYHWSC